MKISEIIIGGRHFLFFEGDKLIPVDRIRWIDFHSTDHVALDKEIDEDDIAVAIHLVNPVESFTFKRSYADDVRRFFNKGYWKD